jgi:hypothetical protein
MLSEMSSAPDAAPATGHSGREPRQADRYRPGLHPVQDAPQALHGDDPADGRRRYQQAEAPLG